ncbi:MAG: GtrA family protein [Phenylobacterium sp.]
MAQVARDGNRRALRHVHPAMEETPVPARKPRRLLAKFTGAALMGFLLSAVVLHLGLEAGLRPWAARLIALLCAMNLTFLVNGRFVFRTLTRRRFLAQWAAYVTNSALGNACNYWVFVTLESTHRPVIGNPYVALLAGSVTAWAINYTGARLVVFGRAGRRLASRCRRVFVSPRARPRDPAPPEPGSVRP